jgi:hypothetical protein
MTNTILQRQQSLEIETVGCFNVGGHQGWECDGSVWRNGGFHHGVGFERFWAIYTRRPCPMDDGLARLITLENVRRVQGVRFRRGSPGEKKLRRSSAWRGAAKKLSQILKQRSCQLEICGFKSFCEAAVDESQGMVGLIALAVFGEQAG